jgi:NTP pyrophosphatase (non-canonical NTP hydrolase)
MTNFPSPKLDLKSLAVSVHAANVAAGWWDDVPVKYDEHLTKMMLVVSEFAEAMEGDRKSLMDDHLPHLPMFDVELADALIRLLDLAGAYGTPLRFVSQHLRLHVDSIRPHTRPEQLGLAVTAMLGGSGGHQQVVLGITAVLCIAEAHEIPIFDIAEEKRAYNAKRADHKAENRKAAGGKAY